MKRFPSIKKNREFQSIYRGGTSHANRLLVMYVTENEQGVNRIGISVSKKVGNSVVRHRLTRLVREAYRLHEDMFCMGMDIVVVLRVSAKDCAYDSIRSALLHLGRKHRIMKKKEQDEVSDD